MFEIDIGDLNLLKHYVYLYILLTLLFGGHCAISPCKDCYVAVTGLPMPETRHAVIMAKFAMDCINKLQEVTRELEATLGPDTALLALRVGMHSGPTTAGVLRGAKSRFQLFGDTVNTSARMESNSFPNKIHVSQATADLLMAAGKGFWLIKRDELIEAKGKGKMQTWWVKPRSIAGGESFGNSSGHDSDTGGRFASQSSISSGIGSSTDNEEDQWAGVHGLEDAITDLQALKSLDAMIAGKQISRNVEAMSEDFEETLSM